MVKPEYIERSEAIIRFCFDWDDIPPTREEFIEFLKRQPAADVVPTVQCKDCRRWDSKDNINGRCPVRRFETPYAGFCEEGII